MDASKMHVMMDIKDELKRQNLDNEDVAEKMAKEKSVVDKQLGAKNGTQTLLTAYGYAETAGGRIVFMLDSEWEEWQRMKKEYPEIQRKLKEKEISKGKMDSSVEVLTKQIDAQSRIIERLEKQIDDKDESIRRKEAAIARKDGVIAGLLKKAGAIE